MELWLLGHGYQGEPTLPGTQRTFDMGTLVEAAMLRGIELVVPNDDGGLDAVKIGPWWETLGEVRDYSTNKSFVAAPDQLSDFQRLVSFAGYKGHIDAILTLDTGRYVLDTKSASGFSYDRAVTGDLNADTFAREYVGQVLGYREGLIAEGEEIAGGILLYFNKEQSKVCARFIDPNPEIVEEMRERLSWAKNAAEPEADWVWVKGMEVPLRCGYCSLRESCAQVRGLSLSQQFDNKNRPKWIVG